MAMHKLGVPSGYVNSVLLKITIEIVDFPIENAESFHSYVAVYQRVAHEANYTWVYYILYIMVDI
jgi:hypothetical protein